MKRNHTVLTFLVKLSAGMFPVFCLILSACSGLKVTQTYDRDADFSAHRTFFILPTDPMVDVKVNRYDKELLLRSIADEMKARGYVQQEANGDLAVNMFVIIDDKTGITNYTSFYTAGGWGYYYPFGYGYGGGNYQYTITRGTLLIDVFEQRTRKLLWQGVGIGTVSDDQLERQRNIPRVVSKIFWKYPRKKQK